ncbi:hypothetical protein [Planctomycetes bacterium Pan216]
MLLSLSLLLGPMAASDSEASLTKWGPYGVGARTYRIVDEDRDNRELITEIWYPTERPLNDHVSEYPSGLLTRAERDVPAAPGPWPWIVFSHSLSAVREQSTFLTEFLASHGFVVVSPDHLHNTGWDFRPLEVYQSAVDRPQDLKVVMDQALDASRHPKSPLHGLFWKGGGVAIGHSLGGYSALAIGGIPADTTKYPIKVNGLAKGEEYANFRDRRIKAVVALAPYLTPAVGPEELAKLRVPTLVIGGSKDPFTMPEDHQFPVFRQAQGPCCLAIIEGASHFSFNNAEMVAGMPLLLRTLHRPTLSPEEVERVVKRLVLAFLEQYLIGDESYGRYLVSEPGVVEVQCRGMDDPDMACEALPSSAAQSVSTTSQSEDE